MHRIQLHYSLQDSASSHIIQHPLLDMLQAVADQGSISGAARVLGLSYRHVWGALKKWETQLGRQQGYLCIVELDEEDGGFHQGEENFEGHNGFRQTELVKILEEIGLEEVESHTFLQDIKTIHEINVDYSLFIMKGKKVKAE